MPITLALFGGKPTSPHSACDKVNRCGKMPSWTAGDGLLFRMSPVQWAAGGCGVYFRISVHPNLIYLSLPLRRLICFSRSGTTLVIFAGFRPLRDGLLIIKSIILQNKVLTAIEYLNYKAENQFVHVSSKTLS